MTAGHSRMTDELHAAAARDNCGTRVYFVDFFRFGDLRFLAPGSIPVVCEKSAEQKPPHFQGFAVRSDRRIRPNFRDLFSLRWSL